MRLAIYASALIITMAIYGTTDLATIMLPSQLIAMIFVLVVFAAWDIVEYKSRFPND